MEERLQKIMSHAGLGSRRACEELILNGRVTVNGRIAEIGLLDRKISQIIKIALLYFLLFFRNTMVSFF